MGRLKCKRITSSTLVENLIALVIISFCLSVALLVTSNLIRDLNQNEFDQWLIQVRQISGNDEQNMHRQNIPGTELELVYPLASLNDTTGFVIKKIVRHEE
ncbi:MAG: hypothetical protein CL840_06595 [Crocinitomicaceae bacterium]|nr:hypothetical protein [Crocinitomicaceae bacterium]|tara:strand:+ start:782 stop:1084 length:303 start_codon:yes stop_codon:yes gene_type:complete